MIKLKMNGNQLVVMVGEDAIRTIILKLFIGVLIYFAIINILIFKNYGTMYTPREWLLNPVYNLFITPNIGAWIILLISELFGWFLFETKRK